MLSSSLSLDCREAAPLLHLYADGEAAPEDRALLVRHLEGCAACAASLARLREMKAALEASARTGELAVPDALVAKVRGAVREAAREQRRRKRASLAFAAVLGAGGVVVVAFALTLARAPAASPATPRAGAPLVEQALDHHTLDVPVDVASPDPSRVGAFLSARIGHPVRVPRLDVAGFGLAGGRIVSVDNQRAAQVVYEGGLGRRVSFLSVPDPEGRLMGGALKGVTRERRGDYAVHVWSDERNVYSLAAALDDEELARLLAAVGARDDDVVAEAPRVAGDFDPPAR